MDCPHEKLLLAVSIVPKACEKQHRTYLLAGHVLVVFDALLQRRSVKRTGRGSIACAKLSRHLV
jgi:hypothetical protein